MVLFYENFYVHGNEWKKYGPKGNFLGKSPDNTKKFEGSKQNRDGRVIVNTHTFWWREGGGN